MPFPIALAMAGVSAGLSGLQSALGFGAQKQDYVNQVAYKKASDEYANWSAGMQAKQANLNNRYAYWQQTVNYNQDLVYTNQMRNFELSKAIVQAEQVGQARASAGAGYLQDSQAMSAAFAQQTAAEAVAMYQYNVQGVRARAAIAAGGQEGTSIDRLMNDYSRQIGDKAALMQLSEGFREGQYTREQASRIGSYLNQYNSQQFYNQTQYNDPIAPFAPLPTLINPPGPSMVGAGPSAGAAILGGVAGAFNAGLGTYMGLKGFTSGGSSGGKGSSGGSSGGKGSSGSSSGGKSN